MKSRILRILLGALYITIVSVIFLFRINIISGRTQMIAILETLLLVIPAVVVLVLYIRVKDKMEKIEKQLELAKKDQNPRICNYVEFITRLQKCELSIRESEVAWLLYRGYTNRQIADELYIVETTVKKHVTHIYEKTQASGRKEFREKLSKLEL